MGALKLTVSGGAWHTFKGHRQGLADPATPDDLHDVGIGAEALANIPLAVQLNGLAIANDEASAP